MLRPSLPERCSPTTLFLVSISSTFGTCVPTPLAFVSSILGICSIVSWLFAQVPQIIKNYTLKSASGLSIYFLAEWLLGDLTNLFGALLTKQAAWQVVVAAYYVTVDLCLVVQYAWYSHFKPWRETALVPIDDSHEDGDDNLTGEVLVGVVPIESTSSSTSSQKSDTKKNSKAQTQPKIAGHNAFHAVNVFWPSKEKETRVLPQRIVRRPKQSFSTVPSSNTLVFVSLFVVVLASASPLQTASNGTGDQPKPADSTEVTGRILSWISTVLYLGSRLPQIYKNHVRRSTSGLSPTLFIAAFFGNLFYASSLLTNPLAWASYPPYGLHGWAGPDGSDRYTWIVLAIPFFLGAAGVLAMDAIVGLQFLAFGEREDRKKVVIIKDERGRSHWRRVTGWMRGWIPSPSPTRTQDEARPLLEDDHGANEGYGVG